MRVDRILLLTLFKIHTHEIRIQNNFYLSCYHDQFHYYFKWLINNIVRLLFVCTWLLPANQLLLENVIFLMDKSALGILKFFKETTWSKLSLCYFSFNFMYFTHNTIICVCSVKLFPCMLSNTVSHIRSSVYSKCAYPNKLRLYSRSYFYLLTKFFMIFI